MLSPTARRGLNPTQWPFAGLIERTLLLGSSAVAAASVGGLSLWRSIAAREKLSPQAQLLMQKLRRTSGKRCTRPRRSRLNDASCSAAYTS